jgi:hypothetical protein
MADGEHCNRKRVMNLAKSERSPFEGASDVKLLIQEVEHKLKVKVIDIPVIDKGSNNHVRCIVLHP